MGSLPNPVMHEAPMKILVCVKQVPDKDSTFRVDAGGTWVETDNLTFQLNDYDRYALEEALRLKDAAEAEVVVCSIGPERASRTRLLRASGGCGGPGLRAPSLRLGVRRRPASGRTLSRLALWRVAAGPRFSPMRLASRRRGALPRPASLALGPTKEVVKWVLSRTLSCMRRP